MEERIRLLKFLSVFMIGGTERQFVNIVHRLDRSKFDLHLACFRKFGAFLPDIEATGHPLSDYSIKSLYGIKTSLAQLRFARYLRKHRIQVVHTYGLYPNLFAIPAARIAGVPVTIASVRDMGAHTSDIKRRVQQVICRMATCVVVNADAVRLWLLDQGISDQKIRVIRNGLVFPDLPQPDGPSTREELGIPHDAPIVGSICRLTAVKGVNYLVEAAGLLQSGHPEIRFVVLGDGECKPALMERVRQLGIESRFFFTGFRTDTHRFLRDFDISVLPSLTEGLSNTLMESMAAGLPVVATRVGGTPEIIWDDSMGLLVEPRDAGTLAGSISMLLENPDYARRLGEAGRRHILGHFSMDQTVYRTEALYAELLAPRARDTAGKAA